MRDMNTAPQSIEQQFQAQPSLAEDRRVQSGCLTFDYARHRIDANNLNKQLDRLNEPTFIKAKHALFTGHSVNTTEGRPALHSLLRANSCEYGAQDLKEKFKKVTEEKQRVYDFVKRIRSGAYPRNSEITDIVNIGIGGSDLGPRMLVNTFGNASSPNIRYHAISNIDPAAWQRLRATLEPEKTLIVLVSKSFKTQETLTNGVLAKQWLESKLSNQTNEHLFAVTANPERAEQFGVQKSHILTLWDWVGGRFSIWSAVSFACMCATGIDVFEHFLHGAEQTDQHFLNSQPAENIPVLMACLTDYYRNEEGLQTHAVIPYAEHLSDLPAYLQQLEMESLGKRVAQDGSSLEIDTGAILWGQSGTNGQHAFHQLLHQGTTAVPVDFILVRRGPLGFEEQQQMLIANCLAQADALAFGEKHADPHQQIPGNKPVSIIGLDALTPDAIGALIATYEHKVFTLGYLWQINAFDQYGVELGKRLCNQYLDCLNGKQATVPPSIMPWIRWVRGESKT